MTDNTEISLTDLQFGDFKEVWDVTLKDMQKHPIWINCMLLSLIGVADDEEDGPIGGTEASTRPLLNSNNVFPEFRHADILLRIIGREMMAVATYNVDADNITTIIIYNPNGTVAERNSSDPPFVFESIPMIDRVKNVRFLGDPIDFTTASKIDNSNPNVA